MMTETEVQKFVGKNLNELPSAIMGWYPVVDKNMTVIRMVSAYDYPDNLELVNDDYLIEKN